MHGNSIDYMWIIKLTKHSLVILKALPIIPGICLRDLNKCLYIDGSAVKSEKLIQFQGCNYTTD